MIESRTLTHKDITYHIEIEKSEPDYSVGYNGGFEIMKITREDGRELQGLINSDILLAILEHLYS
jgi:hypothetical protein